MATEAIPQLLDSSVDHSGLSVVSSQRTADNPRLGAMYNPLALAAGVPVWFHPLQTGEYIGLFRSHWINAVVGTGGPQSYVSFVDAGSCWVRVSPPGGQTVILGTIRAGLTVNSACSRSDYLFTVGSVEEGACVLHHRIGPGGSLLTHQEDILPPINGVVFDKGCYIDNQHLVVIGTDAGGNIFMTRRKWSRIGTPAPYREGVLNEGTPEARPVRVYGAGVDPWEYLGVKGWLSDPYFLETVGVSSVGPVSVATFRDRLLMSTVSESSGIYHSQVYQTRATDPFGKWKKDPAGSLPLGQGVASFTQTVLPLASFSGSGSLAFEPLDSYLGGTMYFQGQLDRSPSAPPLGDGVVAAIPYVKSVQAGGEESAIKTAWGLWSVRSTV